MNEKQLLEYLKSLPENKGKSDRDMVKSYQTSLNTEGYKDLNNQELKIDGIIGPKTLSAYQNKTKGKEVPVPNQSDLDKVDKQQPTPIEPVKTEVKVNEPKTVEVEDKPIDDNPEILFDRKTELRDVPKYNVKKSTTEDYQTPADITTTEVKTDNPEVNNQPEVKVEPVDNTTIPTNTTINENDVVGKNINVSGINTKGQFTPYSKNGRLEVKSGKPGFYPGIGLFARKSNSNNTSSNSNTNYQGEGNNATGVNYEGNNNIQNSNSKSNRKPIIEYDKDNNQVNVNLRKLPKFQVNRADGTPVRFMGKMRDEIQANRERRNYISDEAKRYADDQINQTGMKSMPNDLNKRETKRFSRQVQRNIRNQQQDDLNAIQDENQRARIVNRMEGKADRLVNNYNDRRNNYVVGQNNKTARTEMRQDYKTKREDMIEDSNLQRQSNAIENRQNNFNSRYNKKMQKLENNRSAWETRGMENKNNGRGIYKNGGNIPKYQNSGYTPNITDNPNLFQSTNYQPMEFKFKSPNLIDSYRSNQYNGLMGDNNKKYNYNTNNQQLEEIGNPNNKVSSYNNYNLKSNTSLNDDKVSNTNQYVSGYDETRLENYGDRLQHNANLLPVLYNTSKAIFDKPELQRPIQNEQSQAMLSTLKNNVMNVNMDNINAGRIAAQNTIRNNARSSGSTMNNLLALNTNTSRELNNEQYRVDSANSAQKNTYANALNQVGAQRQQEFQRIDEANRSHRLAMDKFRRDALESGEKAMINKGQMLNRQKQDKISLDTYVNQLSADYKIKNPDGSYTVGYEGGKEITIPKNATELEARQKVDEMTSTDKEGNRPNQYKTVDEGKVKKEQKKKDEEEAKTTKNNGGYIRKFIF